MGSAIIVEQRENDQQAAAIATAGQRTTAPVALSTPRPATATIVHELLKPRFTATRPTADDAAGQQQQRGFEDR